MTSGRRRAARRRRRRSQSGTVTTSASSRVGVVDHKNDEDLQGTAVSDQEGRRSPAPLRRRATLPNRLVRRSGQAAGLPEYKPRREPSTRSSTASRRRTGTARRRHLQLVPSLMMLPSLQDSVVPSEHGRVPAYPAQRVKDGGARERRGAPPPAPRRSRVRPGLRRPRGSRYPGLAEHDRAGYEGRDKTRRRRRRAPVSRAGASSASPT